MSTFLSPDLVYNELGGSLTAEIVRFCEWAGVTVPSRPTMPLTISWESEDGGTVTVTISDPRKEV